MHITALYLFLKLSNHKIIFTPFNAINSRKTNQGTIWHTDRGFQYASDSHKQLLKNMDLFKV